MRRVLALLGTIGVVALWPPVDAHSQDARTGTDEPVVSALTEILLGVRSQSIVADRIDRFARIHVEDQSLHDALVLLQTRTGTRLLFSPSLLPDDVKVTCACEDRTVREALDIILEGTGFGFVQEGGHTIIERAETLGTGSAAGGAWSVPAPRTQLGLAGGGPAPRPAPLATVRTLFQGTVSGRVIDAQSQLPIGAVQVHIAALGIGVLSQGDGSFTLSGVPAGVHTVTAQRLGYRQVDQEVTVSTGQQSQLNFSLARDALALDELVVTGTPGETRTRAIGNVVGRIRAADVVQVAPVTSMQDLIGHRQPGLTFHRTSGNIGTGSDMRIRGVSSLSMRQQPLIYVDGIRVDNTTGAGPNIREGRQVSVLDDFSPEEIESIEIIKGSAAATLYGTEASAGVIQIITKKGTVGAPQFDVSVRQGANWLMDARGKIAEAYNTVPETGEIVSFNIWDVEKAAGRQIFTTGHLQSYTASMRGGTDAMRYFVSMDYDDNVGIVDYNYQNQWNARANLTVIPTERLSVDFSTGFIKGFASFMQQYAGWGVWEQVQWSDPLGVDTPLRGFLRARPEAIATIQAHRDTQRWTGSVTVTHTPRDWITQRFIVGADMMTDENMILFPRHPDGANHDFGARSLGEIELERPNTDYRSLDYGLSTTYSLNPDVRLTSSLGFQYYHRTSHTMFGEGRVFPSPAITSLAGAASTVSSEAFVENKSVGMYLQQEVALNDRVFLTAAVRGDDNSAFGADFDAVIYPKVSAAWVVSEEPFWEDWDHIVNSLRLRSAWGKAGRQPDTFAAVTLYAPTQGPIGLPALSPQVLGNPDLGPEVSTELEIGFDAAFFDERMSAQVTYYTQKVSDALVSVPIPTTSGFPGSQSANLGQLSNWGWEVALDGTVLQRPRYALDLGFTFANNQNRVDDLGGLPGTSLMQEGFPYPGRFWLDIVHAEFVDPSLPPQERRVNLETLRCDGGTGRGGVERGGEPVPCTEAPNVYFGPTTAPYELSLTTSLTFLDRFRVYAFTEMHTGKHWTSSNDVGGKHRSFRKTLASHLRDDPYHVAGSDQLPGIGLRDQHLSHAYYKDFAKLREVGLTTPLPRMLLDRIGASQGTFSLAGRNLWTIWVRQSHLAGEPIPDPEMHRSGQQGTATSSNLNIPPLSNVVATLRMSF